MHKALGRELSTEQVMCPYSSGVPVWNTGSIDRHRRKEVSLYSQAFFLGWHIHLSENNWFQLRFGELPNHENRFPNSTDSSLLHLSRAHRDKTRKSDCFFIDRKIRQMTDKTNK